jgi:putative transcriptional regulator
MTITDNLFWGGDFTMLKDLLRKDETKLNEVRFFVGYAGWDQGQLEHELELNSWVVKSLTDADILKQQPQHLWKNTLRKMGSDIALLSFFPDNPQLN